MEEPNAAHTQEKPQVIPLEAPTEELKQELGEKKERQGGFLSTAQSILTFVVGSVALLTATGFIIVNSYLAQFTEIHGFSIDTSQYLAASVGALLFIAAIVVFLLVVNLVLVLLFGTFIILFDPKYRKNAYKELRTLLTLRFYDEFLRRWMSVLKRRPTMTLIVVILLVWISYVYGNFFYGDIPRYLGGGKPVSIHLIFEDALIVSSFGFSAHPTYRNVVPNVELLSELTDGILVYDRQHEYATVIKNDAIQGIVDANAGSAAVFNSISATAEATPDAAATIAATAEATQPLAP